VAAAVTRCAASVTGSAVALALAIGTAAGPTGAQPPSAATPALPLLSTRISGAESTYAVQRGDSLALVGARFGVAPQLVARASGIAPGARLAPGQSLVVDNRHLAPPRREDGILINVPQRMLFLYEGGELAGGWPVAAGKPDWRTPLGAFRVVNRQTDKPWIVPESIQREMQREGKPVLTCVPPGPDNPLGRHWIGLSIDSLGIHGTIAPASIYGLRSHGCIRMHPDDVATLFERVQVGTAGEIVYHPVLLGRLDDGRIFAEVHPDAYRRAPPPLVVLRAVAQREGLSERIDWGKVDAVVRARDGIAREIGLAPRAAEGGDHPASRGSDR
jgi:L,D-transpeptidase ErfK/SrfK